MATDKKGKPQLTKKQKETHLKKVLEEIEKQRKSVKKGDNFIAPTEEQVRKKLERVNSPFITLQAWSPTTPGGTFNYQIGITNPDAFTQHSMFVHVFVGPGNLVSGLGDFLLNVDQRFPRLTQPDPFGLSLASGALTTLNFSIKVPSTVEHPTNYIGNAVLLQLNWFDVGTVLDRSVFVFKVN
jgi:hypothetical protein